MPSTARIERAQFHRARSASKEGAWPLHLGLEMGDEPIADHGGHLVKIFTPSELVIGDRQENQSL